MRPVRLQILLVVYRMRAGPGWTLRLKGTTAVGLNDWEIDRRLDVLGKVKDRTVERRRNGVGAELTDG